MGREKRVQIEDGIYHVISRGNIGRDIFLDSKDKMFFLKNLEVVSEDFDVSIYSYVLMSNHYHLLIKTNKNNLSNFMHRLNTLYSHYFNQVHGRIGHLFQGRYKSPVITDDKYFLSVLRYIALNPVVAGMIDEPKDYKWGSFKILFQDNSRSWVEVNEALSQIGIGVGDFISLVNAKKIDLIEFEEFEGRGKKIISSEIILECIRLVDANIGKLSDNNVLRDSLIYYLRKISVSRLDIVNSIGISEKSVYYIFKKVTLEIEKGNILYINAVDRIKDLFNNYLLVPGTNRQ